MSSEPLKGMFNIKSPEMFYALISDSLKRYEEDKFKSIERLFFLLLGLNHLCEWIADTPYKKENTSELEGYLYTKIFETHEYNVVKDLCNGSKHLNYRRDKSKKNKIDHKMDYDSNPTMSAWDPLNDVQNLRDGPVDDYYVDDMEIGSVLRRVLDFYKTEYFDKN